MEVSSIFLYNDIIISDLWIFQSFFLVPCIVQYSEVWLYRILPFTRFEYWFKRIYHAQHTKAICILTELRKTLLLCLQQAKISSWNAEFYFQLQVAQMIGEDMVKKVIELFTDELSHYAKEYKGIMSYMLYMHWYF